MMRAEAAFEVKLRRLHPLTQYNCDEPAVVVKAACHDTLPTPSRHVFQVVAGSITFVCSHTMPGLSGMLSKIANHFSAILAGVFYPDEDTTRTELNREGRNVALSDATLAELRFVMEISISLEARTELIAKLSRGRLSHAVEKLLDHYPGLRHIRRLELGLQKVSPMESSGSGTLSTCSTIWTGQELFETPSSKEDWAEFAASPYLDREQFEAARVHPRTIVEQTLSSLKSSKWQHAISKTREDNVVIRAHSRQARDSEAPEFIERFAEDDLACQTDPRRMFRKREWYEVVNYKADLVLAEA